MAEKTATTRSLYHGTLLDHLPHIQRYGLQPGIGDFTRDSYGIDADGYYHQGDEEPYSMEELGFDPATYFADKPELDKSLTAIRHNVANKLGKGFHDVNENDIRNHGLLVKLPGEMHWSDDPRSDKHLQLDYRPNDAVAQGKGPWEDDPEWDGWTRHDNGGMPQQTEPGDYYTTDRVNPGDLQFLRGPAMMRVFQRNGLLPLQRPRGWVPQEDVPQPPVASPVAGLRLARQIVADNFDDLVGHKKLQNPEGQQFLEALRRNYHSPTTDPLMPWMAREFRKGRLRSRVVRPGDTPTLGWFEPGEHGTSENHLGEPGNWKTLYPETVRHWADWYAHPDRRKVPMEQLQVHHMPGEMTAWEQALQAKKKELERTDTTHNVHSWPDGWYLRKLPPEELEDEGDAMGHCVGGYGYQDAVNSGKTQIYSLRDPKGQPHSTMELESTRRQDPAAVEQAFSDEAMDQHPVLRGLPDTYREQLRDLARQNAGQPVPDVPPSQWVPDPNDATPLYNEYLKDAEKRGIFPYHTGPEGSKIVQIQGKGNAVPIPEYQARLKDWFQTIPEDQRPTWSERHEPFQHVHEITGTDEYGDPVDPYENDMYGGLGGYGPHGDYGLADPPRETHYESLLRDLHNRSDNGVYHNSGGYADPNDIKAIYEHARGRGEIPQLATAVGNYNDQTAQPSWDELEQMNYDYLGHYPGEEWDPEEAEWNPAHESEETWQDAKDNYDYAQKELMDSHVPMQIVNGFYQHLQPHWVDDGNGYGSYENLPTTPTPTGQTFSKSATMNSAAYHYHPYTGLPCNCPWGQSRAERWGTMARTAGQQMNKLLKAPDKAYRTPHGETFRNSLADMIERNPDADNLAPFIGKAFKKNEIVPDSMGSLRVAPRPGLYGVNDDNRLPSSPEEFHQWEQTPGQDGGHLPRRWGMLEGELPAWAQWFNARQHPTRRGVNVMDPNFGVQNLRQAVSAHQEDLARQRQIDEDLSHGEVVHRFPNGWHVRHLTAPGTDTDAALEAEGEAMNHCIGSDEQPYKDCARRGDIQAYSLRDPKGWPHGTWHLNSDGSVAEVFGHADTALSPEQQEMYEEWADANGVVPDEVGHQEGGGYDQQVTIPASETVAEHLSQDVDGEWEYPPDANIGEDTQVDVEEPRWDSIADNMYAGSDPDKDPRHWGAVSPEDRHRLHHELAKNADYPHGKETYDQFHQLMNEYPIDEPWEQQIQDEWNKWHGAHFHPITGEFQPPTYDYGTRQWTTTMQRAQQPLLQENMIPGENPWSPKVQDPNDPWTYNSKSRFDVSWFDPEELWTAHVPEDHQHREEEEVYSATDYLEDNRYRKRTTSGA